MLFVLIWIIALAAVVPSLAHFWLRLHDTNRSGGYYFTAFIPLASPIILIVLLAIPRARASMLHGRRCRQITSAASPLGRLRQFF